jgi:hypothetical protein
MLRVRDRAGAGGRPALRVIAAIGGQAYSAGRKEVEARRQIIEASNL